MIELGNSASDPNSEKVLKLIQRYVKELEELR